MDDGTLGGSIKEISEDLTHLIPKFKNIGLELNIEKSELFIINENISESEIKNSFKDIAPNIKIIQNKSLNILGIPILDDALPNYINEKTQQIVKSSDILEKIPSHLAYQLLKYCFYSPKFIYLSRCSQIWKQENLSKQIDSKFKNIVEKVLNLKISDFSWSQAVLPIRLGGIGLRLLQHLSLPGFLSSCFATKDLIGNILYPSLNGDFKIFGFDEALELWKFTSAESPYPPKPNCQRSWDQILAKLCQERLLFESETNPITLARLKATATKESGAWLNAYPSPNLGTVLDNKTFEICVGIRIGAQICEPHICSCGANVDYLGLHGLSCVRSAGRRMRHNHINDIIKRTLTTISVPARLEPTGLYRDDGKRPDGMSLIPWKRGRALVWDATCADTFAQTHLPKTSQKAGSAAQAAEAGKNSKYEQLKIDYCFLPFAVETVGPWGAEARLFTAELKPLLKNATGDPRSIQYFVQRISLAIQRGNAASILGTMPTQMLEEYFFL